MRLRAFACAVAFVLVAACGTGGSGSSGGSAGVAAAEAVAATMQVAGTVKAPWRCALARTGVAGAAPAGWKRDGDRLVAEPAKAKLTIAAVGQARGGVVDLRAGLRAANVDVVVAVGGMGVDAAEIRGALTALLDPAWVVVALPGDSEAWPEHVAAIGDIAAAGGAIVDGAAVRIIDGGAAVVATLPGEPYASRLGAGAEGCMHDAADLSAALAALTEAAGDRARVLVTPPAPQGGASDVSPGGLHAGDPGLAAAVAASQVDLVIHGPIDGTPAVGGTSRRGTPVTLAAGSLDAVARRDAEGRALPTGVTLATVDARGVSWSFLPATK